MKGHVEGSYDPLTSMDSHKELPPECSVNKTVLGSGLMTTHRWSSAYTAAVYYAA